MAWSSWYPIDAQAASTSARLSDMGIFHAYGVFGGAPISTARSWPVVLMSHGTGGSAESLGWLAAGLASEGRVVIAANHHGNTSLETYRAEGFLCWWERAIDLSRILSRLVDTPEFRGLLDLERVSAVGYSLGAHTVLTLAGAVSRVDSLLDGATDRDDFRRGPREFPNLADQLPTLLTSSGVFRESWARQEVSHLDSRVRHVAAIAPPPPVRALTQQSLQLVNVPVAIVVGGSDTEAPAETGAQWLTAANHRFQLHEVGADTEHNTFLSEPSAIGPGIAADLFRDAPGVSRAQVHRAVLSITSDLLGSEA